MKKLLGIVLMTAILLCVLGSCSNKEPTVEVNSEGYVVVNGVKTEYKIHTDDEISVNAEGYVAVNGVVTDIMADQDDVITLDAEGYVIVNGVKTEHQAASVVNDKINYPFINSSLKIESLPIEQQQKIDEYVADCKTIYTVSYIQYSNRYVEVLGEPYLSFSNTFVYDLSKIDESTLDKKSTSIWNNIKALNNGESKPIMYIEFSGFCNYLGDTYKPTSFIEASFIYGYFIFENETVMPYIYSNICQQLYVYTLPTGTELINCGDKYSEEKSMDDLATLYSEIQAGIQAGLQPTDLLKRLTYIQ